MKVLIVEDNTDSRNLLAKQLSAYGHEVTAAVDGVDALEKAQKSPPDILVSDILMPRMDGYKLCYEWKQHKQLKGIPFVFYTAIYTSGEDEKFALSLGANLFIRKPIEPEALAKILSQTFEQAREGLLPPAEAPPKPSLYLTEYNERLVAKLNEKVAELEKSEEEVRYISSVLGAIRGINQLIVRERNKTKLLKEACRIMLKVREYRFVWIGLIEAGHKRITPVARAGVEDKYLDGVEITWDDSPSGQGPASMAIKNKKPELMKNILESQMRASWREEARKRDYRSSAAIPIIYDEKVYGVLNVYSSQPDGFNNTEVELLSEVSSDLAFALEAIERQEALWESEAFRSGLLAHSPTPINVINPDGSMRYLNPAMEKLTGYSADELIGQKPPYPYWLDENQAKTMKNFKKAMRQGGKGVVERFKKKNGDKFWVEITSTPVKKDGKFQYMLTSWIDVTERKQAEEALQQSLKRFADIVENAMEWIWETDARGKYTYASPVVEQILGYKPEEIIGKYFYDLFHPDDREELRKAAFAAFTEKQPFRQFVNRNIRKDGEIVWISTSGVPILDGDGNLLGYRGADIDITERRQAEEALRESEARYRAVIEGAHDMIQSVGLDGSIIFVNKAWLGTLGYTEAELSSLNFFEIVHPDFRAHCREMMAEVAEGKPARNIETAFLTKDGREILVEGSAAPRYIGKKVVATQSIFRDVTERKQAEDKLRDEATRRRILIDESSDGIVILDEDGKVYEANRRFAEMLGYTPEEAQKLSVWDWEFQYPREEVAEMIRTVDETGDHFETRHRRKDGTTIDVEISTNGAIYAGQKLIFCVVRDITERKQAEEKLRDEATRRRILIDESSDGISTLDEKGKIIESNKRFAEMLGYTPEEILKLHVWDFEALRSREQVLEQIKKMGPEGDHFETKHRRKDGTVFDVEVSSNSAVYAGQKLIFSVARDITARKQAEAALRQSEEKLRVILESIPLGVTVTDLDGKILQANNAVLRLHGYSERQELIGLGSFELITEEGHAQAADNLKETLETGRSGVIEYTLIRKDGTTFPAQLSAAVVKDETAKPIGFVAVTEDITERKRAEEALQLRAQMLDGATDAIYIHDIDANFIYVNEAACRIHGYSREEFLKMKVRQLFPPEEIASLKAIRQKTLRRGGLVFETVHLCKDGSRVPVEVHSRTIESGERKLILAIARDITERKQAEAALKESEEKYKNLVEATSDIIWETDAEGRFTFISPKVKDILGYGVDEVVGKKRTLDLIQKGQFQKWLEHFKELNAKREPFFGFEIPHLHKNGRIVICEVSGIPLFDSAGKLMGYVGTNRDITERRQMQEQLVITDRLASVGELAAGIAHELNNPLTGVIGFSQLLLDKEMPEDIKQDVKVVYGEARRASQVVKNLLTFARKHAAAKEQVNINEIIKKVLELRAYEQNLENISVDARLDPKLPEVMVDYFQLQQVFLNIIINAEYFMKEAHRKGELTITTEKVGNKVRAFFADDGPGIAREHLGHLFDPFFTTKEVGKGTGLGLSICHGIVAEHGGRIYVESEPGKGATFIVELPVSAAERKGGGA